MRWIFLKWFLISLVLILLQAFFWGYHSALNLILVAALVLILNKSEQVWWLVIIAGFFLDLLFKGYGLNTLSLCLALISFWLLGRVISVDNIFATFFLAVGGVALHALFYWLLAKVFSFIFNFPVLNLAFSLDSSNFIYYLSLNTLSVWLGLYLFRRFTKDKYASLN